MAKKMATLERAEELLEDIRARARPAAVRELDEIRAFAKDAGAPEADTGLMQWDIGGGEGAGEVQRGEVQRIRVPRSSAPSPYIPHSTLYALRPASYTLRPLNHYTPHLTLKPFNP
jgi:hypothetical protein